MIRLSFRPTASLDRTRHPASQNIGYLWWGWNDWGGQPLNAELARPPWYRGTEHNAGNMSVKADRQVLALGAAIGRSTEFAHGSRLRV